MKTITILRSQKEDVINKSDRLLFFENLSVNSGIGDYHFKLFMDMDEEKKYFINSQLPSIQIKNLLGNFIPILENKPEKKTKGKKYAINTQFNMAIPYIYDEIVSNSLIAKKQQIRISGIRFNQNTHIPHRNIKTHLMKQSVYTRMHLGNYGLYAWDNEYMQKIVMPLLYIDFSVNFDSDRDALNKIDFFRKHLVLSDEYYEDGLNFLSKYIREKILPIKDQSPLPVKKSKKNDLIKLLESVYDGKFTNYNQRMVILFDIMAGDLWDIYSHAKIKGLSKITILLNRRKEKNKQLKLIKKNKMDKIKKMRDHYMRVRIAMDLFGRGLDELNNNENKIVNLTLKKNKEHMDYFTSNKCKHIGLIKTLMLPNYFREKEKAAFEELKKILKPRDKKDEQLSRCSICKLNVLCPHHFELFEGLANNIEFRDIIDTLVKKYSDSNSLIENAYFCRICGEKLVQRIDEGYTEFVNNERINILEEVDNISSVVWREVRNIIMGHVVFKSLIDKKSLISNIVNNIRPLVYNEVEKIKNIKTTGVGQISNITNLYSAIYGYAQLIKLLSHHPDDMMFKYKTTGSGESLIDVSQIITNYPNTKLYKELMLRNLYKITKPLIKLDDIKDKMPYHEGSKILKPQVHIGQRKLLLSEVQFLTKNETKYCIYAGSAPGHKTHLLSTMFPHVKFILVDPNKFELKIQKTNHRKIKHKDIVHIYHEYPTKSNTWDKNKKISEMNPGEIKKMLTFIKLSKYKIFIIEDYYTLQLSEIFSQLRNKSFISDIRSNIKSKEYPSDIDLIWNKSMMYNWIYKLKPDISMIKFRLPFFAETIGDSIEEYIREDFDFSKKLGIDFIADYKKKKLRYPEGEIYLQAWAPISSTELRLYIKKKDIANFIDYNPREIENKMFYFNSISRGWHMHENPNANKKLGFCYCNDCALENNIWEEYVAKYGGRVLDYVILANKATNRPLLKVHKMRLYKNSINFEEWLPLLKQKRIKRNFGDQRGNLGKKGGKKIAKANINIKYLQRLFAIALSKLLLQKDEVIQKINSISKNSIKPLLIRAFKDIQSPIQTTELSDGISANYLAYSSIYRYLYYVKKKNDKNLRIENVKKILGVELEEVPKLSNMLSRAVIPKKWGNDIYSNYAFRSFNHLMNYILNELYLTSVFDNASHLEHIREFREIAKLEKEIFSIRRSFLPQGHAHYYPNKTRFNFKEIELNKIFCKDGKKHKFNIYIYGNTEISLRDITKYILDKGEILKTKLTDLRCSVCDELYSTLKASNAEIEKVLNYRDSIKAFYNLYMYKCPVGEMHKWQNNTCTQCKVNAKQLFDRDITYYNKYKDAFDEYIESVKVIKMTKPLSEDKPVVYEEFKIDKFNIAINYISKIFKIPLTIINNIGLIEGHYFEEIKSGKVNPIEHATREEHIKRTMSLNNYIRMFLIEYEMLKLDNIKSPSLDKLIEAESIDSTKFPKLEEGYISKFRYYSSKLSPALLNKFIMESLFGYLSFIIKNYKGKDDGGKKIVEYMINKIIKAEKNLSKTNIIVELEDEVQGDSEEIANTETIDIEGDFYDPFNTEKFDLDIETHEDNIDTADD